MKRDYIKDFDTWNVVKKRTDESSRKVYAHPREVWWCSLGVNIGVEADGKNENFERPVLVVRVYNKDSMLVLPITGKAREDTFHAPLTLKEVNRESGDTFTKTVYVKLTQSRVISNKRLLRKVDTISEADFERIVTIFRSFI